MIHTNTLFVKKLYHTFCILKFHKVESESGARICWWYNLQLSVWQTLVKILHQSTNIRWKNANYLFNPECKYLQTCKGQLSQVRFYCTWIWMKLQKNCIKLQAKYLASRCAIFMVWRFSAIICTWYKITKLMILIFWTFIRSH